MSSTNYKDLMCVRSFFLQLFDGEVSKIYYIDSVTGLDIVGSTGVGGCAECVIELD